MVGLVLGNHYHHEARNQLRSAQRQGALLSRLQVTMSDFHPEREFIPVMRNPTRFQAAQNEFLQRVNRVETLLHQIQSSTSPEDIASVQPFLEAFEAELESYAEQLETVLEEIDPATLQPDDVPVVQQKLNDFIDSPVSLRLFRFSDELITLIERAEYQNQLAEAALDRSEIIRVEIIVVSVLLSIGIAMMSAVYTSYAIARPIKIVTKVAQQVTQKADFSLQVPITTQDEVGSLASSLNQLIERIEDYTRELQDTQTQLIQTEKMSSLGQMVAGIAHEINNPVNFIYGNLSYTKIYTEDLLGLVHLYRQHYPNATPEIQERIEAIDLDFLNEDLPKLLSSMKLGADRIRQLVLSLRNFSRLDEAETKLSDLHEGIDSTLLLLGNRLKHEIDVVKHYGDLPLVECYPAQINQVFMNIIGNAIDALLENKDQISKKITIQTEAQQDWVKICIQDNGSGIPQTIMSKLFDPFFTTKPIGQGTGLGLAICYQIVEKHHGKIQVHSTIGKGAEFIIMLPIKHHMPLLSSNLKEGEE
ncbi:MAG: HAMP domain-containing protein [Cyanobacteria bacterium CRU_2_1]|nr:HAMP domain-containing protein [Cyanobacteria bacterium RU_5_0]NJR58723.1 HAMP domain-containing protein [Cyanobacteria bacterium CRU_2_1]